MDTKRQYIPTYGAGSEAISHGLNWLLNGNDRLAIHVPSMEQIHRKSLLNEQLGKEMLCGNLVSLERSDSMEKTLQ